ncbi:Chitodextrinase [Actinoplanes sp. SE50]|uniref:hypothetical protein n=1 Tax=unclassified Actinoplanes TaxID=2626549 RepID=UPI00023ED100|nr:MULTISPECIES: hypothetical protein [unclassified Actinoplanes]AEV86653.1 Chitodextrinase [Actinoplanes sp. SE50/110]ATO85051.1 Chitodextrinase [Actinoplanes sp. SE50]SLM02461.1 hypothetical protein ACSP50_5711 [Actinoplanes sp. SE50/110]
MSSRIRRSALFGAAVLLATPAAAHAAPATATTTGVLQQTVADTFGAGPDRVRTTVRTDGGATVDVPGGLAEGITPGVGVTLTRRADGTVSGLARRTGIAAGTSPVSGTHHLVFVPVHGSAGTDPATLPTAADFTTVTASVDRYYDTVTGGAVRFTVDRVLAPQKLTATGCDTAALENAARDAAGAVTQDRFHHLVVYYPYDATCGFAGLAYVGGQFVWLNGYKTTQVLGHELGHNLGLWHSDGYHCYAEPARQTPVPLSANCTVEGYADPWDIMGSRATGELTAAHLDQLGLLGDGGTQPAAAGRRVVLAPLSGGTGLRQLTVTAGTRTYYLEYRDGGRLDQPYARSGTGLAVRFTDTTLDSGYAHDHQLVSYHPEDGTITLKPGEGWNDPGGALSIRTGVATADGLPVTVGGVADTTAPTAFTLTGPAAGASLTSTTSTVTWTPVTDDSTVAAITVLVDGRVAATASGTATATPVAVPDGRHTLQAVATDPYGNASRTPAITVTVDGTAPAGTPAPAAIPRVGAEVTTGGIPVRVAWGLTDANGVARQRIAQDGATYSTLGTSVRQIDATAKPGVKTRWQLAVADRIGHTGTVSGAWTTASLNTRGGTFSGAWRTVSGRSLLGGSEQTSTAKGAAVSYTFTGRAVGLIGTRDSGSGAVDVYVDGAKFGSITLYNGVVSSRRLVYTLVWSGAGKHTVTFVNQATAKHPKMSVDGIVSLS